MLLYTLVYRHNPNLFQQRPLQFHHLLHNPLSYILPIILPQPSIPRIPILPIRPLQRSQPRPQHGRHPACNQTDTHRSVGVAVEGLLGVICVAFEPDVVEGDYLGWFHAGFSSCDSITGKTDDAFDSAV